MSWSTLIEDAGFEAVERDTVYNPIVRKDREC